MNLLVLLTVGAMANDTFGFFSDWTDLAGAFQSVPCDDEQSRRLGGHRGLGLVAGGGLRPRRQSPPLPPGAASDRQFTYTVKGPLSGLTGDVVVDLPRTYSAPSARHQRFPVIEAFHGYPGTPGQSPTGWHWAPSSTASRRPGRSPPPWSSPLRSRSRPRAGHRMRRRRSGPARARHLADPGRPQLGRPDLPGAHRQGRAWAAAGISAGGWCAAMASLLHPGQYGSALIFGGYFGVKFGKAYQPWPTNSPLRRQYDLISRVAAAPPPVAMWVETSHSDRTSFASSEKFLHVCGRRWPCTWSSSHMPATRSCYGRASSRRRSAGWVPRYPASGRSSPTADQATRERHGARAAATDMDGVLVKGHG